MALQRFILPLLIAATPALAEEDAPSPLHVAAALGAGTAYDGLGVHVQLRFSNLGAYVGVGALGLMSGQILGPSGATGSGFCGGVRWYQGDVFFVSLNATHAGYSYHYDPSVRQSQLMEGSFSTFTLTIGGRWHSGRTFFEAGLGGGLSRSVDPGGTGYTGSPPPGTKATTTSSGIPDLSLAFGFEI